MEDSTTIERSIKSTQKGLPIGWTRATFIIGEEVNKKLKALAYWRRITVKEVVDEALTLYIKDKQIPDIPAKENLQ